MSRPLLQLALDHSSLEDAQRDVTLLKDSVDIVEAGTILCLNEGLGAVKALREQCPDKIIVADWKVADAGETLAQQAFGAGANWMTIICASMTQKKCLFFPMSMPINFICKNPFKVNYVKWYPQHLNHKTWFKIRIQRLI